MQIQETSGRAVTRRRFCMIPVAFVAALMLVLVGRAPPADSAERDAAEFHAAVDDAYGHYRESDFYLRTGNAGVAAFELEALEAKWRALVARFAAKPPRAYAADTHWTRDLADIGKRAAEGLRLADAGEPEAARAMLKPVRRILGDMRRRNGIFLFSDCVDGANGAMEGLYKFRHAPPDFERSESVRAARRATAEMRRWYVRCRDMASPGRATDTEFKRLMERSLYSIGRLDVALDQKNQRMFINIIRELRSSDRILFLRFG